MSTFVPGSSLSLEQHLQFCNEELARLRERKDLTDHEIHEIEFNERLIKLIERLKTQRPTHPQIEKPHESLVRTQASYQAMMKGKK